MGTGGGERRKDAASTIQYLGLGLNLAALLLLSSPLPSLGAGFQSTGSLMASRLLFFCALAIFAVVATWVARRSSFVEHWGFVAVAMVVQAASGAAYPLVSAGVVPEGVLTADMVVTAAVIPLIGLAWSEVYSWLSLLRRLGLLVASMALCAGILILVQWLPATAAHGLMFLLPFGTIGVLLLLRRAAKGTPAATTAPWEAMRSGGADPAEERTRAQAVAENVSAEGGLVLGPYLAAVFFAAAASCVLRGSAEAVGFIGWASVIAGVVVAVLVLVGCLFARKSSEYWRLSAVFAGVMTASFALAGLVFGPAGLSDSFDLAPIHHLVTFAAQQCLYAVVWLALMEYARAVQMSPLFCCGAGFSVIYGGEAVGVAVGMFAPLNPSTLSILALVFLVPSMYLFAASGRQRQRCAVDASVPNAQEALGAKMQEIAKECGLTARETEIACLWVTGHRLDYLSDELFISKNTVKTHLKHIYQKTGTANKEEFITFVESYGE